MISDRELPFKIEALNEANRRANDLQLQLLAFFLPRVGEKIEKADGSLLAKVEKALAEYVGKLPCTPDLHVYRSSSAYTLQWAVKVCKRYGDGCTYAEATVTVGDLRGDTLVKLADRIEHRTDYSVEKVREARQRAAEAKRAYESARDECYPFGEW